MKKINFNQKGITLIELLLVFALVSIAMVTAYSIYFTGNKSFSTSRDIGFAQQDARLIADYIKNQTRTAKNLYIDENEIEENEEYYSLTLENKKLSISHSEDSSKDRIIGSSIESIKFSLKDADSGFKTNIIGLTVETDENGHKKQYEVDISFENGDVIVIDGVISEPISGIYYTKY